MNKMKAGFLVLVTWIGVVGTSALAWEKVTEGKVISISVSHRGTIYGVGTDGAVYRTRPFGQWQKVTVDGFVTSIALHENTIYGLGTDGNLYSTQAFTKWTRVSNVTQGYVKKIAMTPRGRLYGVGNDGMVYRLDDLGMWQRLTFDGYVVDIAVTEKGYLLGLGTDGAIYGTRPNDNWTRLSEGEFRAIGSSPEGELYAVGDGLAVYRQ